MWPDERGQSLVEMALVLPLLLLLLAGIIDFGRAYNNYIIITNAAREGARFASRFPCKEPRIIDAVGREATDSGVPPESITVTIVGLNALPGETIEVAAEYEFDTILGSIVGVPSLTLHSSTAMVVFGGC
jgi:hypothetical protein